MTFTTALSLLKDIKGISDIGILFDSVFPNLSNVFKSFSVFSSGGFFKGITAFGSSMLSLMKAHPVITALAGAMALDKFVFTMDDKFENAQEAIQNYQSTQQEIEGVNNELATTQSRMNELLAKDSLTLVEKDELSKLL